MKVSVKLEKAEEDALRTISTSNCLSVSCYSCPFRFKKNDLDVCIRAVCQSLLEDYLDQK